VWDTQDSDIYWLICQPDLASRTSAHSNILGPASRSRRRRWNILVTTPGSRDLVLSGSVRTVRVVASQLVAQPHHGSSDTPGGGHSTPVSQSRVIEESSCGIRRTLRPHCGPHSSRKEVTAAVCRFPCTKL